MERMLKLSVSSVRSSPTAASSASAAMTDASPWCANGRSLLNDALSPSGRRILQDFLDDDERVRRDSSVAIARQTQSPIDQSQRESSTLSPSSHLRFSPASRDSTVRLSSSVFDLTSPNSKNTSSFVQIQCNTRPFCLKLVEQRGEMIVTGFVPDLRSGAQRGVVERSGLVLPGDVLVAVNDEVDALTTVQTTVDALMDAQLPAVLTFRRVPIVKSRLGDYTVADIARNLTLRGSSALLSTRTIDDAALLVRAMVDVLDCANAATPLVTFIARVEKLLALPVPALNDADARAHRIERIEQLMQTIHRVIDAQQKEQLRKWNADKPSQFKRIDVMAKQRASIDKKLEAMRANPELLNPENHATWQAYVELRHLSHQMRDSVERAKREHYLPDLERYSLRLGSDGIYVGIGDIWIPSFYAKFTLETRAQAPHVFVHVSTPATHGLKLRAKNFTLSTEGRLPSFHCDELNLEAQLIADVPLVYDAIHGWRVPPDDLHVKLMSLAYYERTADSTKKGQNHDMVMKMLINRVLPSLVRHAVQNVLCGELGPLLESRNAQVVLAGEIKIQGTKLALYDAALDASSSSNTNTPKERALAAEARELMGMSQQDAATLFAVFKALTEAAPAKKKAFSFAPMLLATEPKRLSIRSLQNYFAQFEAFPHHRALAIELWSQMMELLAPPSAAPSPGRTPMEASTSSSIGGAQSFSVIVDAMEVLNEYPVDVSVSLLDLTFRLDLCEGAATYYTSLQRILRQEMDSVSVGLSNLDSMRDGTFLEHELAKLDDQYERINRVLAYITTNVDDCGAVFSGSMPAGFRSKLSLEATDIACKGPCGGTFTIPLTDLAQLQRGNVAVDTNRTKDANKAMASALTHEDGALVFSKFFLSSHRQEERAGESADDETSSSRTASDKDAPVAAPAADLPRDRLQVRVKNTSARVLFELPSDRSLLNNATTFVPFSLALVTSDEADEPPRLRVETGEFAKCQYKAEQVAVSGTAWQFLKRTKESADHVLQPDASVSNNDVERSCDGATDAIDSDSDSRSVWEDYVESPFLRLQFLFFTSCQVTREHMFWSIKSASLAEPKVAHVKHRVCLVQLLQDVKALRRKLSDESATRQRARQRYRAAEAAAAHRRGRSLSISSAFSDRETLFSHASFADMNDDFDRLSESMHSAADTDAFDAVESVDDSAFNGIEAFEEENSGDESDESDESEDSDANDDVDGRFQVSPAKPDIPVAIQTLPNGADNNSSSEDDDDDKSDKDDESKSEPEAAQEVWERRFEREVSEVSTDDAPRKTTTTTAATTAPSATLHKQTSVFF